MFFLHRVMRPCMFPKPFLAEADPTGQVRVRAARILVRIKGALVGAAEAGTPPV